MIILTEHSPIIEETKKLLSDIAEMEAEINNTDGRLGDYCVFCFGEADNRAIFRHESSCIYLRAKYLKGFWINKQYDLKRG